MTGHPSKAVRNERLKLRASAMNSVAVASVVAEFVTPVIATSYGIGASSAQGAARTVLAARAWLCIGVFIHYLAGRVFGGLEE